MKVRLLTTTLLPPNCNSVVEVQAGQPHTQLLLELLSPALKAPVLVNTGPDGLAHLVLTNQERHSLEIGPDDQLATATAAELVEPSHSQPETPEEEIDILEYEREQLHSCLQKYHHAFALEDSERGKTSLVEMEIETGDEPPRSQHL